MTVFGQQQLPSSDDSLFYDVIYPQYDFGEDHDLGIIEEDFADVTRTRSLKTDTSSKDVITLKESKTIKGARRDNFDNQDPLDDAREQKAILTSQAGENEAKRHQR